jgi:hypothetical protein
LSADVPDRDRRGFPLGVEVDDRDRPFLGVTDDSDCSEESRGLQSDGRRASRS